MNHEYDRIYEISHMDDSFGIFLLQFEKSYSQDQSRIDAMSVQEPLG